MQQEADILSFYKSNLSKVTFANYSFIFLCFSDMRACAMCRYCPVRSAGSRNVTICNAPAGR